MNEKKKFTSLRQFTSIRVYRGEAVQPRRTPEKAGSGRTEDRLAIKKSHRLSFGRAYRLLA